MAISISPSSFFHKIPEIESDASLEIHVLYENGSVCEGALVSVYDSFENMENNEHLVCEGYTDSSGKVSLTSLSCQDYFFFIKKGEYSNSNGVIKTWVPLQLGKRALIPVKISN